MNDWLQFNLQVQGAVDCYNCMMGTVSSMNSQKPWCPASLNECSTSNGNGNPDFKTKRDLSIPAGGLGPLSVSFESFGRDTGLTRPTGLTRSAAESHLEGKDGRGRD